MDVPVVVVDWVDCEGRACGVRCYSFDEPGPVRWRTPPPGFPARPGLVERQAVRLPAGWARNPADPDWLVGRVGIHTHRRTAEEAYRLALDGRDGFAIVGAPFARGPAG